MARLIEYLTDDQHKTADDLYTLAKEGEFRAIGGSLGIGAGVPAE